jgi:hypothetical protein
MHAARHTVGELGDDFRMCGIFDRADDDAVLAIARAFAREHEELAVGERHDVVDAPRVRDDRIRDNRRRRIADVDRVHDVATTPGAEVGVFAVGMQPDFFGAETRARQTADDAQWPPHFAIGEIHRHFDAARAK